MPIITAPQKVARQLQKAVAKLAKVEGCSVSEMESELGDWIWGENSTGRRTILQWKYASSITSQIEDGGFFAIIWRVLKTKAMGLEWLERLLEGTGVPVYKPISSRLLYAYLEKARIEEQALSKDDIELAIKAAFPDTAKVPTLFLQELIPLEPVTTREHIKNAASISVLGLNLFRFLPVFQHELRQAVAAGTPLKVLLVAPDSCAVDMIGFRSTSQVPTNIQRGRIEDVLRLLGHWVNSSPQAKIEVRLLDYLPPYGITIYQDKHDFEKSVCLVRLYTFRTPTSEAPAIWPDPIRDSFWFDFFCEQFEMMWEAGQVAHIT